MVSPEGPLDQNAQPGDLLVDVTGERWTTGACSVLGVAGPLDEGLL